MSNTPRFLPLLLAFCMFSTGASGLVNEYVLATITTYILGNSIEQFSIVIASMMLMMGISGFVQSKMSDRYLLQKFIGVEVLMALLGGFAPLAIYAAFGYMNEHFTLVLFFFILSIGFLIGFEIPLVMRIIDAQNIQLKTNLTIVYAMDYIGAFVGAIIWIKFLLLNFPLTEISFIVAGFNFFIATIAILYFLKQRIIQSPAIVLLIIIATAFFLVAGYLNNRELNNIFEQKFYDDPIVFKTTSKYQHIVITQNKTIDDTRLYINGNTQFSSIDEVRYHDFLVHPVMSMSPSHSKILVLGGGDGLALRELNKYTDIQSITLVDLDPEMIKVASTHPSIVQLNNNAFANAKVSLTQPDIQNEGFKQGVYQISTSGTLPEKVALISVYNIDAERFLRNISDVTFDVIVIDLPDPSSVELSKLYSQQFYKSLRQHLAPNGFVAIQSTSPFHAKPAYLAIGATLSASGFSVLPYRQNIPSFGDWGFYLAWRADIAPQKIRSRIKKIGEFDVDTQFITPELLVASLAFGKGELDAEEICINTMMEPCLLQAYTRQSWLVE